MDTMTSKRDNVIMTEMISVADAKRRFSELVERVGRGERFVVTRRGTPVVALVEPEAAERREPPGGVLALMGVLADYEGVDEWAESVREVIELRKKARPRPLPDLG
jgi:prevent-host-death family protein